MGDIQRLTCGMITLNCRRQEEEEAYHALVAEGGRPSHSVALGYDVVITLKRMSSIRRSSSFGILNMAGITKNSAVTTFIPRVGIRDDKVARY